jgi:hypothetical protein
VQDRQIRSGGCLCGAVRYELSGELRDVVNCHCTQCRRFHGHVAAYTAVARDDLKLVEDGGLEWCRSSEGARRGFCARCGSSLLWERIDAPSVSISAGSLDQPSGLRTVRHAFVADKADYYEITDGLEKLPGTSLPR